MKVIKNDELTGNLRGYKNRAGLMIDVLSKDAVKGMTVGEMRKRTALLDKIESVKGDSEIELEDSEAEKVKSSLDSANWAFYDEQFITLSDALS